MINTCVIYAYNGKTKVYDETRKAGLHVWIIKNMTIMKIMMIRKKMK